MNQRRALQLLFSAILVGMLAVTTWASLQISLWDAWAELRRSPWVIATLLDAYFGFITFFVWVAWRERSNLVRAVWFVLIMCLGNIAMPIYVLIALGQLDPNEHPSTILRRKPA